MGGFVDIHCHILPGVDDGAQTVADAVAMVAAAAASGVTTLVATPHVREGHADVDVGELGPRLDTLRAAVSEADTTVRLVVGAELGLSWALAASDEDLRLASYQQHGLDLLIETPSAGIVGLARLLYPLRLKRYRITLAHPERAAGMPGATLGSFRELVAQGVVLQVDAEALVTDGDHGVTALAQELCREGLAAIVASDGHRASAQRRITMLAEAVGPLTDLVGTERAEWMVTGAPQAVVEGGPIPMAPDIVTKRRRRWVRRS